MSEVFHGGGLDAAIARFGGARADWLDLSTGINPNPYPVGDIASEAWARLPDNVAEKQLLDAAWNYYQVPDGFEIVAAPGTQAIIQALPHILSAKRIYIPQPTYGEHDAVWSRTKARVMWPDSLDQVNAGEFGAVVVNPNNPDCRIYPIDEMLEHAARFSFFIVDEAFCDSVPDVSLVPQMPDNAIILKSFGKFFGLAGVRLGFAICKQEWAEDLREQLGPWAVSGPALAVGAKALADDQWIAETRDHLVEQSQQMANLLESAGLTVEGINPLFVYCSHKHAWDIYEHLARHHVLVRPFPGWEEYLRFGLCCDEAAMARLKTVLAKFGNA